MKKKRIIVGMSGGVDSSVTALLLQQQGHHVEGLFMKNWEADDTDTYCTAEQDFADVKSVCAKLQIPLHTINFSREYWERVFNYFLEEYQVGRTPNPDILCNKEIKFKAFLEYALTLGADYIATGHYANITVHENTFHLLKSNDTNKDQSYFLYTLGQHELSRSLFPIGHLHKKDVRKIAKQAELLNADKKDSTGICFIGERNFKKFLQEYLLTKPGVIKNIDDNSVVGQHDGLMYYTRGQRRSLRIGGIKNTEEAPWYVVDKDIKNNILLVAQGRDHPTLFSPGLTCTHVHWIVGCPALPFQCFAKTRYRQQEQACTVLMKGETLNVLFDKPQWAITPGQSVVFYQDNECMGGGVIESVIR